jgi:hypothetical protein
MKNARKGRARAAAKYPSKASLREMPERRADTETKPNKFAAKIAKAGGLTYEPDGEEPRWVPLPQGRPKKTDVTEPSKPRSVRLPDSVWAELQKRARERGIGVHTLLRELVAHFMGGAAKPRKRARKVA